MFIQILFVTLMPLILWVVYWCYTVVHFEKYLRKIPGKIGLPLFGVALEVRSPTSTYCSDNFINYLNLLSNSYWFYYNEYYNKNLLLIHLFTADGFVKICLFCTINEISWNSRRFFWISSEVLDTWKDIFPNK